MSTIAAFPNPDLTGIPYSRYWKPKADYDQVTYEHTFEDKGISVNSVNVSAPQKWEIEFNGLSVTEAKIWQDHYTLAFHNLNEFPFTEKDGTLQTGVRYLSFDCTHDGHKSWIKTVKCTLIKRP